MARQGCRAIQVRAVVVRSVVVAVERMIADADNVGADCRVQRPQLAAVVMLARTVAIVERIAPVERAVV